MRKLGTQSYGPNGQPMVAEPPKVIFLCLYSRAEHDLNFLYLHPCFCAFESTHHDLNRGRRISEPASLTAVASDVSSIHRQSLLSSVIDRSRWDSSRRMHKRWRLWMGHSSLVSLRAISSHITVTGTNEKRSGGWFLSRQSRKTLTCRRVNHGRQASSRKDEITRASYLLTKQSC